MFTGANNQSVQYSNRFVNDCSNCFFSHSQQSPALSHQPHKSSFSPLPFLPLCHIIVCHFYLTKKDAVMDSQLSDTSLLVESLSFH